MNVFRRTACTRLCAATLAAALAFQPLTAYAAPITETLAEVPIQGLNPVKPNIMFTMDDSGSMGWDFLPDYVAYVAPGIAHCRDGLQCGGATGVPGSGYVFSQYDPPVRSSSYNGVFYDPAAVYRPGKKADGTDLPCEGSDTTCGAPWTAVYNNGFAGYPGANTGTDDRSDTRAIRTRSGAGRRTRRCWRSRRPTATARCAAAMAAPTAP